MEDRNTRARLRDAAVEIVAESGAEALTARGVAERAGLSPGLIRHHFGSMEQLLIACDDHVARRVRESKEAAIAQAPGFDALATVRATGNDHVMGYLAMRLADDSPRLDELVDALVDDARQYLADGVAAGMITPTADEHARAAMLTIYALGSLALHRHLARHLDVDVRAVDLAAEAGFARYLRVQLDVFSGVVAPDVLKQYRAVIDSLEEQP